MRVLVIGGGGAIGVAFARHFQLGGAHVGVLVRPRQEQDAKQGVATYHLNRRSAERHQPVDFVADEVFIDQAQALEAPWDAIVLAVAATALVKGDWLQQLARASGDATIVGFANGPVVRDLLEDRFEPDKLVWGMLNIISYQAPLPHETLPRPGIAYWFPPGGLGFSGPASRRDAVVHALKQGGLPGKVVDHVYNEVAFMAPILGRTVLALECAGWSFSALAADRELLPLAMATMRESWTLAEKKTGRSRGGLQRFLSPFWLRRVLALAPWVLPLDLEAFFGYHYVKIGDQTLMNLQAGLAALQAAEVESKATEELLSRLQAARARAKAAA